MQVSQHDDQEDQLARPDPRVARTQLTRRERQIAALIADGLKNHSIARKLSLSPATVASYVQRIQARLGLSGRREIAEWVTARISEGHRDILPSAPPTGPGSVPPLRDAKDPGARGESPALYRWP